MSKPTIGLDDLQCAIKKDFAQVSIDSLTPQRGYGFAMHNVIELLKASGIQITRRAKKRLCRWNDWQPNIHPQPRKDGDAQ